jgi:hypothetical protein
LKTGSAIAKKGKAMTRRRDQILKEFDFMNWVFKSLLAGIGLPLALRDDVDGIHSPSLRAMPDHRQTLMESGLTGPPDFPFTRRSTSWQLEYTFTSMVPHLPGVSDRCSVRELSVSCNYLVNRQTDHMVPKDAGWLAILFEG